jgi:tetratricopeptide (TPR) repeat protein
LLEQAVAIDPDYDGALSMLGWINYSGIRHDLVSDPAPLISRLEEVIALLFNRNKNDGKAYFLTAGLRLLEFDYQAAIEAGLKAVELKPNDPNTHGYLAQIYCCMGQPKDPLLRINYAQRISPYYATWMLLPLIDIHSQLEHFEKAFEFSKTAVKRAPDSIQYYSRYLVLLNQLGKFKQAKAGISQLLELDPT